MRRALILLLLAFPATAGAAYEPKVGISIPAGGGPASPAALSATISQSPGEEAHRTIEVRLPGTFGFNSAFVQSAAPIGRVDSDTAFGPASGELFLTDDFRLVARVAGLGGLVPVTVTGLIEVLPGQEIVVRFDGLPSVQTTRIAVTIEGGARTPLALPRRCGTHVIKTRLVSRGGAERAGDHPIVVGGCRAPLPKVTEPRVARGVLRWKTTGAARTEVTLRRFSRGAWHEISTRTTTRTTLRLRYPRRGRHAVALVPVAADGTRGLTQVLRLS